MIANSPAKSRTPSVSSYTGPTQPIPKKSLQIRTDKPRPHVCTICTRGFARLEHLKRHERSHTNEKPFQCAACGRCFARRDLVLRHQQKLHSQVSRRSLLPNAPTSAPASNGTQPESSQSTPSNDHIIVLHNNTHAKAPLPDSRTLSPLGMQMPNLTALSPAKHMVTSPSTGNNVQFRSSLFAYGTYDANGLPKHNMPSPNTNLSLNTPLANLNSTTTQLQLRRASHAVDPTQSTITQQPSPVTGDSPDLKDKKVGSNWLLNFSDETAKANLKQFSHLQHLEQNGHPQYRHASFSAVSGASYTNLKDALAIQSHQFADVPQQVGFATPQHTAAEIDSKGLRLILAT